MSETYAAPAEARVDPSTRRTGFRASLGAVLGVLAFAGLSGVIPAYLLASVGNVGRSDAWPLTLAVMLWAGGRLSLLIGRGQPRLFEFFFWLYVYIFLGLAATVQMRSDSLAETTPGMDPAVDLPTAVVIVIGLVAYELGRALGTGNWLWIRRTPQLPEPPVTRALQLSQTRAAVLFVIAAASASYYLTRYGLGTYFSSREAAAAAAALAFPDPATLAFMAAFGLYPLLIAVGALAQLRRRASAASHRPLLTLGLAAGLVLVLLQVSPLSTARYTVGTVFFALAVYLGATLTTARVRITMLSMIGAFLFVFPLADAFRREGPARFDRRGFFGEYRQNGDYDSYWQIANAYSYWRDDLVEPFRQFSGSVFFWVPRALWSDKPVDTGVLLADYRRYSFGNLSAPLWAESLVNGGLGLLVVVFFLLGWGLRRLDTKVVVSTATGGPWAIVGAVFPVYLIILLRGSLLQATGGFALALAAVLFVGIRARSKDPAAPGSLPRRETDAARSVTS